MNNQENKQRKSKLPAKMSKRKRVRVRRSLFLAAFLLELGAVANCASSLVNNIVYGFKQIPEMVVALVMALVLSIVSDWLIRHER